MPARPKLAPDSARAQFKQIIRPRQFADAQAQRRFFDAAFPQQAQGDAYAVQIGARWFITNTRENEDVTERVAVPLQGGRAALTVTLPVVRDLLLAFVTGGNARDTLSAARSRALVGPRHQSFRLFHNPGLVIFSVGRIRLPTLRDSQKQGHPA